MTFERLYDLRTILTKEEIEELRRLCYEYGNSMCPISDFFNDIEQNTSPTYDKNQAYKDLWLIVLILLDYLKENAVLRIIKEKSVDIIALRISETLEQYNCKEDGRTPLEKEEYKMLKEVLV